VSSVVVVLDGPGVPQKKRALVATACDEHYAPQAALALISAATGQPDPIGCALFTIGVDDDLRRRLERVFRRAGVGIGFHPVDPALFSHVEVRAPFTVASLVRLIVPRLLAGTAERTIYIDADTLTLDAITPLLEADLQGAVLGAVVDPLIGVLGHPWGVPAESRLDPAAPYFNAGVLVIDNAAWQAERIEDRVIEIFERPAYRSRTAEQSALNEALVGRWRKLDSTWNTPATNRFAFCAFSVELSRAGIHRVVRPSILHFFGRGKPWDADYPPSAHRALYRSAWGCLLPEFPLPPAWGRGKWLVSRIAHGPAGRRPVGA
jgi:lipopolysaccharide biosynthesis glycosyltransferase